MRKWKQKILNIEEIIEETIDEIDCGHIRHRYYCNDAQCSIADQYGEPRNICCLYCKGLTKCIKDSPPSVCSFILEKLREKGVEI